MRGDGDAKRVVPFRLRPSTVTRVEAAAGASGVSRQEWLERAVFAALGEPQPGKNPAVRPRPTDETRAAEVARLRALIPPSRSLERREVVALHKT